MNYLRQLDALILVRIVCGACLLFQQPSSDIIRTDVRLVVLPVTVRDKSGQPPTVALPRDAFSVFENGQAQSVQVFKHEDVPISLGLVLDCSGSMSYKRGAVAAAAMDLVRESNPDDEEFVVNFSSVLIWPQRSRAIETCCGARSPRPPCAETPLCAMRSSSHCNTW